jgi:hypothetical protein
MEEALIYEAKLTWTRLSSWVMPRVEKLWARQDEWRGSEGGKLGDAMYG